MSAYEEITGPPASTPCAPLPATAKQLSYARTLATRNHVTLPLEVQQDRARLSRWIEQQRKLAIATRQLPSSRQVAFAEALARRKRTSVPEYCFKSREEMTRWISRNS